MKIDSLMEQTHKVRLTDQIYKRSRTLNAVSRLYATGMTFVGLPTDADAYTLAVEKIPIYIANLPAALVGTKIAQISDLHMSKYYRAEHLSNAVERIAQLNPDFLCMSGDYAGPDPHHIFNMIEPLQNLQMPTFAVMGNHDYKRDYRHHVLHTFDQLSIPILRNQAVQIKPHLWLVGLDDVLYGDPRLDQALQDIPQGDVIILLVHEPDYFTKVIAEDAPITLQISGHTHGGQIQLPARHTDEFGRKFWTPQKALPRYGRLYPPGLWQVGERLLYTNRGLGFTGPPIRINCRPEITLFTLLAA